MKWQIHDLNSIEQYWPDWNRLNRTSVDSPLLEQRFVAHLLKYFSTGDEKLAVASNNETIIALAVLTKGKPGSWSTFQPSQSPLGLWIHDQQFELEALLKNLAKTLPGFILNVGITQQDPDMLQRPAESSNISTLGYIDTARITIDGDFDDYWSKRGKNLRQNMNRQRNRLARENITTRLITLTSPEEMELGVKMYGELESAGWKSENGTAVHIDNHQGQFYKAMLSEFAKTEDAQIYQYWYDDTLTATDLCIGNQNTFIILKTTYDESQTTSSPALLMRREYFESLINNCAFKRIEFYGKVMTWHTKWSDEIRTMYHVNFYPWSIIKRLKT